MCFLLHKNAYCCVYATQIWRDVLNGAFTQHFKALDFYAKLKDVTIFTYIILMDQITHVELFYHVSKKNFHIYFYVKKLLLFFPYLQFLENSQTFNCCKTSSKRRLSVKLACYTDQSTKTINKPNYISKIRVPKILEVKEKPTILLRKCTIGHIWVRQILIFRQKTTSCFKMSWKGSPQLDLNDSNFGIL